MTKKTRRKYSDEFKDEAVKLVTEKGYKISEAARNLGVHVSLLRKWIQKRTVPAGKADSLILDAQAEIKRLRKENDKLRMEREILKKAAAFFANESV